MTDALHALRKINLFELGKNGDSLQWQPFRTGVEIYPLHGVDVESSSAALLRYAPGAKVPAHLHSGYEHILVLSGSQKDEHGENGPGTLMVSPPDSRHSIVSPNGCIVLAIWELPVKFIE